MFGGRKNKKDDKKKDRKGEKKRGERERGEGGRGARGGAGGGLPNVGLFGMPQDLGGIDLTDEAALEAELRALEGNTSSKSSKAEKSGSGLMDHLDTVAAGLEGLGESDGEDSDLSEGEEAELLGELEVLTEPTKGTFQPSNGSAPSSSKKSPQPSPRGRGAVASPDLMAVTERLKMYETAVTQAQEKGDSSKLRRYNRAVATLISMEKQARAGNSVNLDDLPPIIATGAKGTPAPVMGAGSEGAGVKVGGSGGAGVKVGGEEDDEFELSEEDLAAWAGELVDDREKPATGPPAPTKPEPQVASKPAPQPPTTSRSDETAIASRLELYQQALKEAEGEGAGTKVRRYKRSIGILEKMLKDTRSGRKVNMEDLPPLVAVQSAQPSEKMPPQPKPRPRPTPQAPPTQTSSAGAPPNLINLDDPEFDEFTLSEEDLATMAMEFMDDRGSKTHSETESQRLRPSPPRPKPKPRSPGTTSGGIQTPQTGTKPKPQPKPRSKPPEGILDLDAPEFDEFNFSEEELAALSANMVDDRAKKPKLDLDEQGPSQMDTQPVRSINESEIVTKSLPTELELPASDRGTLKLLLSERKEQYTSAMKQARVRGNGAKQKEYGQIAVQFGRVLKALGQGQEVDLTQMPGPPPGYKSKYNVDLSQFSPSPKPRVATDEPAKSIPAMPQPEGDEIDPQIPVPKTPLEALEQRLVKYREGHKSALEKGESSRIRRLGRIIKQYEQAIRATRSGKPLDYSELPAPPGYPPIPTTSQEAPKPAKPVPKSPQSLGVPVAGPKPTQSLPAPVMQRKPKPSLNDQQLAFVRKRKEELVTAARQTKAKGDRETALHYVKLYKGLQTMIESAENGLPVNLDEVPPSPFANISATQPSQSVLSHLKLATEADAETFDLIEKQLQKQIEICDTNAEAYKKVGNIGPSSQYQNMSQGCQRELLAIKGIRSQSLSPPKFTLETRKLVMVHSHNYLSDNQCELEIVKALSLPCPSGYQEHDLNVFIEVEFPWPSTDESQKATTSGSKGSSNPAFNFKCLFDIDRKHAKGLQRVFKRHPVKCTLWQRRTLRKDLFMGQALLSLESLERHCQSSVCVDLLDERGRKPSGGKLEAILRLREPLSGRDHEEKEEQWLVFQDSIAAKSSVAMPKPSQSQSKASVVNMAALSPVKIENTTSIECLKLEYSLVQNALKAGHKDSATIQRGHKIQARIQGLRQRLQTDKQGYAKQISRELQQETAMEQQLLKSGKTVEAKILAGRRKVMEKELKTLQGK